MSLFILRATPLPPHCHPTRLKFPPMEEAPPTVNVTVTDRVQRRRAAARRQRGEMSRLARQEARRDERERAAGRAAERAAEQAAFGQAERAAHGQQPEAAEACRDFDGRAAWTWEQSFQGAAPTRAPPMAFAFMAPPSFESAGTGTQRAAAHAELASIDALMVHLDARRQLLQQVLGQAAACPVARPMVGTPAAAAPVAAVASPAVAVASPAVWRARQWRLQ